MSTDIRRALIDLIEAARAANAAETEILARVAELVEQRAIAHDQIMGTLGHLLGPQGGHDRNSMPEVPEPVSVDPRHAEAEQERIWSEHRQAARSSQRWN